MIFTLWATEPQAQSLPNSHSFLPSVRRMVICAGLIVGLSLPGMTNAVSSKDDILSSIDRNLNRVNSIRKDVCESNQDLLDRIQR